MFGALQPNSAPYTVRVVLLHLCPEARIAEREETRSCETYALGRVGIMVSSLASKIEGGNAMKNEESGSVALNEAEFEELLRLAYESKESNLIDNLNKGKNLSESEVQLQPVSCM